jgi:hypothetical protein
MSIEIATIGTRKFGLADCGARMEVGRGIGKNSIGGRRSLEGIHWEMTVCHNFEEGSLNRKMVDVGGEKDGELISWRESDGWARQNWNRDELFQSAKRPGTVNIYAGGRTLRSDGGRGVDRADVKCQSLEHCANSVLKGMVSWSVRSNGRLARTDQIFGQKVPVGRLSHGITHGQSNQSPNIYLFA